MLLVVDIGNTNIVWGVYDDHTLAAHWRLATDVKKTSDEYGILFANLLAAAGIPSQRLSGAIISSVVPALTGTVEDMIEQYFHQHPLIVTSDTDTGLTLRYANPKEIGSDRLVNAAAAYHKYRRDLIVVDFGTATTFCAITAEGHYLGGVICPRPRNLCGGPVCTRRQTGQGGIDPSEDRDRHRHRQQYSSRPVIRICRAGRYRRPTNGTGTRTLSLCHRHRRTQFHPGSRNHFHSKN